MSDENGSLNQEGSAERSGERDVGSNPTPRTNNKPPAPGLITEHAFWIKKEGYKPSTIERRARILKVISRKADLKDVEAVKIPNASKYWFIGAT